MALRPLISRQELVAGELLFRERESSRKLYLVDKGELVMRRTTPFGDVAFASYLPGQVSGEMDFIDFRLRIVGLGIGPDIAGWKRNSVDGSDGEAGAGNGVGIAPNIAGAEVDVAPVEGQPGDCRVQSE